MRGLRRNDLQNVPVLDDVAIVVEPEDVDPRPVGLPWPRLVAVQDDVRALGARFTWTRLSGHSVAMRSKNAMKASLPSATPGLCWM